SLLQLWPSHASSGARGSRRSGRGQVFSKSFGIYPSSYAPGPGHDRSADATVLFPSAVIAATQSGFRSRLRSRRPVRAGLCAARGRARKSFRPRVQRHAGGTCSEVTVAPLRKRTVGASYSLTLTLAPNPVHNLNLPLNLSLSLSRVGTIPKR